MENVSYGVIEQLRMAGCDVEFVKMYMDPEYYDKRRLMIEQHRDNLFKKIHDDHQMLDQLVRHQAEIISKMHEDQLALEHTERFISEYLKKREMFYLGDV